VIRRLVLLGVLAAAGAAIVLAGPRAGSSRVRSAQPLTVVAALTPRFHVRGYDTSGTYAQVRRRGMDLHRVNAGLRAAVLENQRSYATYARKHRAMTGERGVYRTGVDGPLVSASTVVVSALIPLTSEVFPGQSGGDKWLGMTVRVPSGRRVTLDDLFEEPQDALRVFRAHFTGRDLRHCARTHPTDFTPVARNYKNFALTSRGLAVGFPEDGACYRLVARVGYRYLKPFLTKLGTELVAGVRGPR